MNRLERANRIQDEIRARKGMLLAFVVVYANPYDLPASLFQKQRCEVKAWLESRVSALEREFAKL